MILFFGTRPGKRTSMVLERTICPYCGQTGTIMVHSQPQWFHLFWIKLFTVSTHQFGECSHCKRGFYKEDLREITKTNI
ncbi:MAG: zinc-ribbon domain-containing protein [Flavobacteriaceae bacterium]